MRTGDWRTLEATSWQTTKMRPAHKHGERQGLTDGRSSNLSDLHIYTVALAQVYPCIQALESAHVCVCAHIHTHTHTHELILKLLKDTFRKMYSEFLFIYFSWNLVSNEVQVKMKRIRRFKKRLLKQRLISLKIHHLIYLSLN